MGLRSFGGARFVQVVIVVVVATAGAAVARAQEGDPADALARDHFQRGREAYESGRFEEALLEFERSYELSRRPALLFNIAQASDRLGRNERAVEGFRAYLDAVPDASNRAYVEARIRVLAPTEEAEPEAATHVPWAIAAFGAAVVAGGLATFFWIDANDAYDALDASCGEVGCTEAEIDASGVVGSQTLAQVFLGVGIVALSTGIVVLAVGGGEGASTREASARLELGPAGVRMRGRW